MREALLTLLREHRGLPFRTVTVFNYLLEAAVFGGVLILLLLAVRRFFRRQLGSRAVYAAWLLVAVRLLVPLAIPNPVMDELGTGAMTDQAARPVAAQVRASFRNAAIGLGQALDPDIATYMPAGDEPEDVTAADFVYNLGMYTSYGWTGKWLFFLYLAGALAAAARMTAQNVRFRRRLRQSLLDEPGPEIMAEYRSLCEAMKLRRAPAVRLADPLPSACLTGFFRPVIAVSAVMPEKDMRLALRHELAHYRVRDHWWSLLRNLCCCVQWFNPLVWVGAWASRQDGELACDERVTRGMNDEERRAYAETLLHAATRRSAPGLMVCATGMTVAGRRLRQRLTGILRSSAVRRGVVMGFTAVSALIAVMAFCTAGTNTARLGGLRASDRLLVEEIPAVNGLLTPQPIAGRADAAKALLRYLNTDALSGDGFGVSMIAETSDICVMPVADGWSLAMRTGQGVIWALLDHDGRMLAFNGNVLHGDPQTYRGERPSNLDEAAESYIRRLAVGALGASEVTGCRREEMYTFGSFAILARCAALLDGEPYTFDVRLDAGRVFSFEKAGLNRDAFIQQEAYRRMIAWMISELRWDGSETLLGTLATLDWDDARQELAGVVSIETRVCGEATRAELIRRFGESDWHTLRLSFDRESGAVTGVALVPETPYTAGLLEAEEIITLPGRQSLSAYRIVEGRWVKEMREVIVADTLTVVSRIDPVAQGLVWDRGARGRELMQVRYEREDGAEATAWVVASDIAQAMKAGQPVPEPVARPMTIEIRGETRLIEGIDKHLTNWNFDSLEDTFLLPEEAISLALEASMDAYGLTLDELLDGPVEYGFRIGQENEGNERWPYQNYWQLDFSVNRDLCEVFVQDGDGTILRMFGPDEGNG